MDQRKKVPDIKKTEIGGTEDIQEIEHKTAHPGADEINIQNVNYAPGENAYLNDSRQGNLDE